VGTLTPRDGPERIGPYALRSVLGRGSAGTVYLAVPADGRSGAPVALKVLRPDALDAEGRARFEVEVGIGRRLDHPGIVRVLDAGRDGPHLYVAMELGPTRTLRDRLREGPLPPDGAARLVAALARATATAHDQGVVHRDLKPANVLLDVDERPRIADFGLARAPGRSSGLTRSGEILGTPCYMAPEQLRGERADARADVYALGAILFECVSGRRLHQGATTAEVFRERARAEAPRLRQTAPHASAALEAVCRKALAPAVAARHASARELAEALESATRPPARRARARYRVAAAALFAGLAAGAAIVAVGTPAPAPAAARGPDPAPSPPRSAASARPPDPTATPVPSPERPSPPPSPPPAPPPPEPTPAPVVRPLEELMRRGDAAFQRARYAEAEERFRTAVRSHPAEPLPRLALGHALLGRGELAAAAASLRRGLARAPGWPAAEFDLRRFFPPEVLDRRLADLEERAAAPDPDALFLLGYVRHFYGQRQASQAAFTRLRELAPDDPTPDLFRPR